MDLDEALLEHTLDGRWALGTYAGSVTWEQAAREMEQHLGEVLLYLQLPNGDLVMHVQAPEAERDDEDGAMHIGSRRPNAWRSMGWFNPDPDTPTSQYTGGARAHLDGGIDLVVILWQGVWHETDSGDLAPGIGGFTVQAEPREETE